jgi:hypothetical protein
LARHNEIYPSPTKILEGRTNISERVFEALFKGVSTRFGLRIVEKVLPRETLSEFDSSFHNLRLGRIELVRQNIDRIMLPSDDWGRQMDLPSQTKSLEDWTNDSIRMFQSTFQGREYSILGD